MVHTYEDFEGVLEIEISCLRDAEDYLNDEGKLLLRTYRKIRKLTAFAENCRELIEVGLLQELNEAEQNAARLALGAVRRIAKAEMEAEVWKELEDQLNGVPGIRYVGDAGSVAEHGSWGGV